MAASKRRALESSAVEYGSFVEQPTYITRTAPDLDETIPQSTISMTLGLDPSWYEKRQSNWASVTPSLILAPVARDDGRILRGDILLNTGRYNQRGDPIVCAALNGVIIDPAKSDGGIPEIYTFAGVSTSNTNEDGSFPSEGITGYIGGQVTVLNNSGRIIKPGTKIGLEYPSPNKEIQKNQYQNVAKRKGASATRLVPKIVPMSPFSAQRAHAEALRKILSFSQDAPGLNIENLGAVASNLSPEDYLGQALAFTDLTKLLSALSVLQAIGWIEIKIPDDKLPLDPVNYRKFDAIVNENLSDLIKKKVVPNAIGVLTSTDDIGSADMKRRAQSLRFLAYKLGLMPASRNQNQEHLVSNQRLMKSLLTSMNLGSLDPSFSADFGLDAHVPQIDPARGSSTSDPSSIGLIKRRALGGQVWNSGTLKGLFAKLQSDCATWNTIGIRMALDKYGRSFIGVAANQSLNGQGLDINVKSI